MRLHLATALFLASVAAAYAQPGSAASQMAGRAAANANEVRDAAANGVNSLYTLPDDATAEQSSDADRIIRSQVTGTQGDPVLHYPYGRYSPTLGNVDPNSLGNPFVNRPGTLATVAPAPPSPFRANAPAFGISSAPAFGVSSAPAFSRGR